MHHQSTLHPQCSLLPPQLPAIAASAGGWRHLCLLLWARAGDDHELFLIASVFVGVGDAIRQQAHARCLVTWPWPVHQILTATTTILCRVCNTTAGPSDVIPHRCHLIIHGLLLLLLLLLRARILLLLLLLRLLLLHSVHGCNSSGCYRRTRRGPALQGYHTAACCLGW